MRGQTRFWFLSAFFFYPLWCAEMEYECGAHGKFEYCVDGIPGCVVGCHCHPGYYFDTDSKICEHNSKLTKGAFRRYYNPEPTRIQDVEIMTPPNKLVSTMNTTSNPVEDKIDEITKDADDLGDWLYNQFFKTIENQVINKTQDEEPSPSRRSGSIQLHKPSRRSHHRSRRHKQKKKKSKSKSLKNKLLRITEDDSLFDSSSGSTSDSEETSSSASSEESCASSEKKEEREQAGHGHKKILIFNKKPQPPLPSFIFLPNNMDSPFYPPMGIAAPPMPMYPMVPVPPMIGPQLGPPMFPYPGPPCEETSTVVSGSAPTTISEQTTIATTTTTVAPTITTGPKTEGEPPPPSPDDAPPDDAAPDDAPPDDAPPDDAPPDDVVPDDAAPAVDDEPAPEATPALRSRLKKKKNKIAGARKKIPRPALRDRRNKLLKKLREKMNRKNKLENYYMAEQFQDPNIPLDLNEIADFESKNHLMAPYMHDKLPEQRDVDFKYLADLIHKTDMNRTLNQNRQPSLPPANAVNAANQIPKGIPGMIPLEPIVPNPNRRSYYQAQIPNQPLNNFRRLEPRTEINDTFYTDLGKQIASMIRKIDTWGDREVNIEIEGPKLPVPHNSPVFNENNYASRSFWERSVRSPLRHSSLFRNEMENIKRSNEDLFSLERKVEVAASTSRTLSLHDIENIISFVQKKRTHAKRQSQKIDHSNTSFKFDLLPNNNIITSNNIQKLNVQKTNNSQTTTPPNLQKPKIGTWVKKPITRIFVNKKTNKDFKFTGLLPERKLKSDVLPLSSPYFKSVLTRKYFKSTSNEEKNEQQDVKPTRKPSRMVTTPEKHIISYIMPSVNRGIQLNRRSHNNDLYSFHKNPYLFDDPMPMMQYTGVGYTKNILPNGKINRPSYFHHEFHHFDYIDQ